MTGDDTGIATFPSSPAVEMSVSVFLRRSDPVSAIKTNMKRSSITTQVLLACTSLVALPALADFSDNFQSGDNAWTHYSPLTPFGSPATYSFPNLGYQISVPQSLAPTQLGDGRGGSFVTGQSYSDFSLSFDVFGGGGSPQFTGAFTRVTTPGLGTLNGYAVGFDYATDQLGHQQSRE